MSYCRWGWNGSDVYIYAAGNPDGDHGDRTLVCCGCEGADFTTYGDLLRHISDHRAAGEHVPAFVDERLYAEINDPKERWVPVGELPENMHPDPGPQRPEPLPFTAMREALERAQAEQKK